MYQQPQPTQSSQGQGKMRMITSQATKFQVLVRIKELSDVFKSFDVNGDGKISRAELQDVMRVTLGYSPSEQEIYELVGNADWDGDGCIDLREFIRLNSRDMNVYQTMDDLRAGFQIFDLDKSGRITAEELHRVVKRLGDPASLDDCRGFINAIDLDGDGVVSFEEFHVLLPPPPPHQSPAQPAPLPSPLPSQGQGHMRMITNQTTKFQVLVRIKELTDVFKSFDLSGDGKISRAEIRDVMRVTLGYNPSDQDIHGFVGNADWDGDGCIDLREFIRLNSQDMNVYQTMDDLRAGFQIFDLDKSGRITAEELHRVVKRLGDPASLDDCRGFINAIDLDGDGAVSFEEFQVLLPPPHSSSISAPVAE